MAICTETKDCKGCGLAFEPASWRYNYCDPCRDSGRSQKNRMLQFKYGMTLMEFEAMKASQDFKCDCCGSEPTDGQVRDSIDVWVVDHNHETGEVRGLICNPCNLAVWAVRESPENALSLVQYLVKYGA